MKDALRAVHSRSPKQLKFLFETRTLLSSLRQVRKQVDKYSWRTRSRPSWKIYRPQQKTSLLSLCAFAASAWSRSHGRYRNEAVCWTFSGFGDRTQSSNITRCNVLRRKCPKPGWPTNRPLPGSMLCIRTRVTFRPRDPSFEKSFACCCWRCLVNTTRWAMHVGVILNVQTRVLCLRVAAVGFSS